MNILRRPNLLTALIVVVMTAGIALADGTLPEDTSTCDDGGVVTGVTGVTGSEEPGLEGATGVTGPTGDSGGGEDCDDPEVTGVTGVTGEEGEEAEVAGDPVDRQIECETAAGVEPSDGGGEEPEKLTGLDNAIAHVLANCLKNPQAPGLVNALERLAENKERHADHEAAKAARAEARAERKAVHDAWKAAKQEARGSSGHGQGHGQGHGNPHD